MNDRYPNFDILRLLLALEVVVAHAWHLADTTFEWAGYIMAVPAFLAISGFLVLKSYEESGAWRIFIKKRVRRLLPALLVSFALCLALFDWLATFNALLNWITGGLYELDGVLISNGPLWSLAWEELAYLFLALLWMAGAYKRPFVIWILFAAALCIVEICRNIPPQRLIILQLLPAFFIGNLAYLHRERLLKVASGLPWALLVAVILSPNIPFLDPLINHNAAIQVSIQAFAVVWVGMAGFRVISFRFPDISYGLYIYHWPIAVYLTIKNVVHTPLDMLIWLTLPLLAISLLSWYVVEKPALTSRHPFGQQPITANYPNFDLLKLMLALEVVVLHAWQLTDPTFGSGGVIMAVPAFLAISGFLVLKSRDESGAWGIFIQKRALRLLPALVASMAFCWALFGWAEVYGAFINWVSGGLLAPGGMINTPLWSLVWAKLAYLCMALLWIAGAYKRPVVIWALLAMSMAFVYAAQDIPPQRLIIIQLMPAFFIGNLAYLHHEQLLKVAPVVPWAFLFMVIASANLPFVSPLVNHNEATQVSFQAFAVVWVGMAGFRAVSFRFPDISYGLYIYHWPIIAYLLHHKLATTSIGMAQWLPIPLLAVCLASWYLVEKPALRLKPQGALGVPPTSTPFRS